MVGEGLTPRVRAGARRAAALALLATCSCAPSRSALLNRFSGHWQGTVAAQGEPLAFGIDLERRGDALEGRLSSPDLLLLDVRLPDPALDGETLRLRLPDDEAPPEMALKFRGKALEGTMRVPARAAGQLGDDAPRIHLERAARPAPPYAVDTLRFRSGDVPLAASRFTPRSTGPHPAVLLLHGSSLDTRDAYFGWADAFARAGFVTLVYDRRGSGASSGSLARASLEDLVSDALAAMIVLGRSPGVDPSRVLVWGLSLGGMLAPEVALRGGGAGVIAVSAPGVGIGDAAAFQDSIRVVRAGFPEREGARAADAQRQLTEWAIGIRTGGEIAEMMQGVAVAPWRNRVAIPRTLLTEADRAAWSWAMRARDPLDWWRRMSLPALLVYGQRDALAPARTSAMLIQDALAASGAPRVEAHVFAGADHSIRMESAGSGSNFEWPRVAPGAVDTVLTWMKRVTRER